MIEPNFNEISSFYRIVLYYNAINNRIEFSLRSRLNDNR